MARGAAARRYAKALFELAKEEGQGEAVRGALSGLAGLLEENAELRDVLLRPLHPVAERRAVLTKVAAGLQGGSLIERFCAFLIEQRRLLDFGAIRAEYERLSDLEAGVTTAAVRSASPLDDGQRERLKRALAARTGRQIELAVEVDPALLGGVIAQVGDLIFDGSLRTQLTQLRSSLAQE